MMTSGEAQAVQPPGVAAATRSARSAIASSLPDERRLEVTLTAITPACVMSAAAERLGPPPSVHLAFDVASYVNGGWFAVRAAVPDVMRGHLDVDLLMVLAAVGAAGTGHWHEGGVLLFLFSIGQGMLVKPGEAIPTDGVVTAGLTEMNEATITGEATPVDKAPGDLGYAGALRKGVYTMDLSRRAVRTVRVNLAFSFGVILLLIASVFWLNPPIPLGVVGHEGSTIPVCANGLRLLRTPHRWFPVRLSA